ncbi:MAG: amidohydrolase [Ruminococcaceae bacterium]|nr:amidohydrolase [Oscillospiraceae bacterium]
MKYLFENACVLGYGKAFLATDGEWITYIGKERPQGEFDQIKDMRSRLLIPGLYNTHCHCAMSLFRGYGEDMPLQSWLNDRIFPAEDRLTDKAVYGASLLSIAEMIQNGIVSFSDMYFFCDQTAKAVAESGIKANLSRSIVSFDENEVPATSVRYQEGVALHREWHGAEHGRIRVDMSVHAEYTNVARMCRAVADYAKENKLGVQLHLSETEKEHNDCLKKRGITPLVFFEQTGLLDVPVTAAHCVYVSDEDMALIREKNVTAAHNPVSNLKLASGVMRLPDMLERGINVTLGTDGSASNNTLDILKEMYIASILQKGITRKADGIASAEMVKMATLNGACAQGRENSGRLAVGYRADIVALDLDALNNIPLYDPLHTLLYSANASNVCMTMVDGSILYENGEFTTLDIEQIKYNMKDICLHYFD